MSDLTVEREFKSDLTIYLDGIHVLSNEDARQLFFNLAAHIWPELSEKNALRLLANESLTNRNAELEAEISKLRAACEAALSELTKLIQLSAGPGAEKYDSTVQQLRAALEGGK